MELIASMQSSFLAPIIHNKWILGGLISWSFLIAIKSMLAFYKTENKGYIAVTAFYLIFSFILIMSNMPFKKVEHEDLKSYLETKPEWSQKLEAEALSKDSNHL